MTPELFAEIAAQGYNHIPVTDEVLADLDTPLSCYVKVPAVHSVIYWNRRARVARNGLGIQW